MKFVMIEWCNWKAFSCISLSCLQIWLMVWWCLNGFQLHLPFKVHWASLIIIQRSLQKVFVKTALTFHNGLEYFFIVCRHLNSVHLFIHIIFFLISLIFHLMVSLLICTLTPWLTLLLVLGKSCVNKNHIKQVNWNQLIKKLKNPL